MKININEVLRYLGAKENVPEDLRCQTAQIAEQLTDIIEPRFVYRVFSISKQEDGTHVDGVPLVLTGNSAETMLAQCSHVALLVCTIGAQFDALLRARQVKDMGQAVILDACGSALVESGCDVAAKELANRFPGKFLTDRFSPGYGDLPLSLQPGICGAVDAARRIGVQVTDNLLLNPVKSVTAFIGISDEPQMARIRGCAYCAMREHCTLRKGGTNCELS